MLFLRNILFLFCFLLVGFHSSANSFLLDSLLEKVEDISLEQDSSDLTSLYVEIGDQYLLDDNYSKALEYFELGLDQSDAQKNEKVFVKLLSGAGKANKRLTNYEVSLDYFHRIIEGKDFSLDYAAKADAHNNIGYIFKSLGEYQKAYQSLLDALHFHDLAKDSSGIGQDYYALGSIFFYQKRFNQSLTYYQKAKTIFTAIDDKRLIYKSYAAIGYNYSKLNQLDKSYEYGFQAYEMAQNLDYKLGMAYSRGNLAEVHLMKNELKLAEKMFLEALQLKMEINDNWGVIGAHLSLMNAYLVSDSPDKAIPHLDVAHKIAKEIGSKTRLIEIYQGYERTYEAMNDYPEAYSFLKKYTVLRDSVLNEKTLEEMGLAKKRFELEKKESEIALLTFQNNNLEQRKKIQQLQTYLILFLAFVLFISFWFVKSRLNLQKKTNQLLEEKNEEIEHQNAALHETQSQLVEVNVLLEQNNAILGSKNEEIAIKNKQLENSNEDLENFAYVASHDLKEPLRMINSYTALLKRRYNDMFDETGQEFMFFVTDAAKRMNVLLDDLLNYSRVGKSGTMDNIIDVNDVLLIVRSNLSKRLEEEKGIIQINKENMPSIISNHTQMVQLFQNIVSNALKFRGERDPLVTIDCSVKDGKNIFSIKDNGIGIAPEHQERVFEMFKRLHTRDEYEGTGIGLSTCKKIVVKHGGDIWLESEHGVGTTFYFSIPVKSDVPAPVMN